MGAGNKTALENKPLPIEKNENITVKKTGDLTENNLNKLETPITPIEAKDNIGKLEQKIEVGPKSLPSVPSVEKVSGKLSKGPETFASNKGTIQKDEQKLSSPLITPTTEASNKDTQTGSEKPKPADESISNIGTGTEAKSESSSSPSETNTSNQPSEQPKQESSGMDVKLDAMINLLLQMNDTLSGPLLVTSTQKKFE